MFQPAEEGGGGAREMMKDGLFEKFPMEAIFGAHNWPGMAVGQFALRDGPVFASSNEFKITIHGKGAHAAMPHNGIDPVPVACQMVQAFQTIITRNKRPIDAGVISVTMIHAGEATNVVPDSCVIEGTVRTFTHEVLDLIERRMKDDRRAHLRRPSTRSCEFEFERNYPPTINHEAETEFARRVLADVVGADNVHRLRADDGRRGLQLLPAGQARLLLPDRQRRRRAPRGRPRHGAVHAAQPELRLQRRPDPARRHRVGAPGGEVARSRVEREARARRAHERGIDA